MPCAAHKWWHGAFSHEEQMMKFRCKASGCIVEFTQPVDIETTAQNPAYEIVEETQQAVIETVKVKKNASKEVQTK